VKFFDLKALYFGQVILCNNLCMLKMVDLINFLCLVVGFIYLNAEWLVPLAGMLLMSYWLYKIYKLIKWSCQLIPKSKCS